MPDRLPHGKEDDGQDAQGFVEHQATAAAEDHAGSRCSLLISLKQVLSPQVLRTFRRRVLTLTQNLAMSKCGCGS